MHPLKCDPKQPGLHVSTRDNLIYDDPLRIVNSFENKYVHLQCVLQTGGSDSVQIGGIFAFAGYRLVFMFINYILQIIQATCTGCGSNETNEKKY